jgi:hypothetical protein
MLLPRHRAARLTWCRRYNTGLGQHPVYIHCRSFILIYISAVPCSETSRLELISQMHQPYVLILTTWCYTWTTWTSAVSSVARLSKSSPWCRRYNTGLGQHPVYIHCRSFILIYISAVHIINFQSYCITFSNKVLGDKKKNNREKSLDQ